MSSKPSRILEFAKVHSAGNDFVIFEAVQAEGLDLPALAQRLCRRKVGVGSDGMLLYAFLDGGRIDFRFFNPDGSEAEICGNGVISLATLLNADHGIAGRRLALQTKAGVKYLVVKQGKVLVNLGQPSFTNPGVQPPREFQNYPVAMPEAERRLNYVNVGNPHASIFVDDLDFIDLVREGRLVERLPIFPDRVNVEFVQVMDKNNLIARFWERGAGYTLASGSGASAAAVISIAHRFCESPVTVHTEVGRLEVFWKHGSCIVLKGEGVIVYRGRVEL